MSTYFARMRIVTTLRNSDGLPNKNLEHLTISMAFIAPDATTAWEHVEAQGKDIADLWHSKTVATYDRHSTTGYDITDFSKVE